MDQEEIFEKPTPEHVQGMTKLPVKFNHLCGSGLGFRCLMLSQVMFCD